MTTEFERRLLDTPTQQWTTRQAVILEWHDGPREGLCELANPSLTFYFEILAECHLNGQFDDGMFRIYALEDGSVERAINILRAVNPREPTKPTWAPYGLIEDEAENQRVMAEIDAIVSNRSSTRIICRTADMILFTEIWMDARIQ
jgi:hypothetical protein